MNYILINRPTALKLLLFIEWHFNMLCYKLGFKIFKIRKVTVFNVTSYEWFGR